MFRFPVQVARVPPREEPDRESGWLPRYIQGTRPAVGTNFVLNIGNLYPARLWKMGSVSCAISADANIVGGTGRVVSLALLSPDQVIWEVWTTADALAASTDGTYIWARDIGALLVAGLRHGPIPTGPFITTGRILQITLNGIQAGDQIRDVNIEIEERAGAY